MTMRNAEQWLDESLSSLYNQTYTGHMELSVYNDGSMVRYHTLHYNSYVCISAEVELITHN